MICDAILSPCKKYRYQLRRIWQPAVDPLVWIMLNPSTADAARDDATIRRCIGFSMNDGYGGIEVYNLFAWRSTYPAELLRVADPVGKQNATHLQRICNTRHIVCAWGNGCRELFKAIQDRRQELGETLGDRRLQCLGWTEAGQPVHPLRIPYTRGFAEFAL